MKYFEFWMRNWPFLIKDGPQMELIHSKLLTFMAIVRLISTMLLANPIINMEILAKKEVKTVSKWDSMVRGRMPCVGENIQKRRVGEKEFSTRSFVNQNHWKLVWNVLLAQSHQQMRITKSYQLQKSGNFSCLLKNLPGEWLCREDTIGKRH